MGPVVEGGLPDVEPARSDSAVTDSPEGGEQADRGHALGRSVDQPSPRKRHRRRGLGVLNLLQRIWVPLVILAVIAAGGFAVSKLRSVFGSDQRIPYSDTRAGDDTPLDPSYMRYEVFGAPGTVATISYFGAEGSPEDIDRVTLPWSLEFPITSAAGVGSVAAQGDTDTIGCRILVGGEVKDEKIVHHEVSAFTSCILKAA